MNQKHKDKVALVAAIIFAVLILGAVVFAEAVKIMAFWKFLTG